MNTKNNFTIGTDPEFFLISKDGSPVSAEGIIGGNKKNPIAISEDKPHNGLQEDNVMVEITVPACIDAESLHREIELTIKHVEDKTGLKIVNAPSMRFPKEILDTPQAKTVGCDPDYNAYTKDFNPIPDLPDDIRFAGGHVHIGNDLLLDVNNVVKCVKLLDLFLGVPSVIMDTDVERKKVYGIPGRFRFKPYGIEYRTLSNFWTRDVNYIEFIFQGISRALDNLDFQYNEEQVYECIINNNVSLAKEIIKNYKLHVIEKSITGMYEKI